MKNKKIISIILLLVSIILLQLGLGMLKSTENRWIAGSIILASVLIIGTASKMIANDIILKNYLEAKTQKNIKINIAKENIVKQKASSRANLIVSLLLVIALILMFFVKLNYNVLTLIIILSIFLQSSLNAFLYIYYDKRIKDESIE